MRNLLRSSTVLNLNFGSVTVRFGQPVSLRTYTATIGRHISTLGALGPENTGTDGANVASTSIVASNGKSTQVGILGFSNPGFGLYE